LIKAFGYYSKCFFIENFGIEDYNEASRVIQFLGDKRI